LIEIKKMILERSRRTVSADCCYGAHGFDARISRSLAAPAGNTGFRRIDEDVRRRRPLFRHRRGELS